MMYTCEKCDAELNDDTDRIMILTDPDSESLAYCLDDVTCAEAGADVATTAARRDAAGIKSGKGSKKSEQDAVGDSE